MILPSRRKHQITRQNTRLARTAKIQLTLGVSLVLCLLTFAAISRLSADEDPLDQLRDRSAEKRWKTLRERFSERRSERRDRTRSDEDADTALSAEESAMTDTAGSRMDRRPLVSESYQDSVRSYPLPQSLEREPELPPAPATVDVPQTLMAPAVPQSRPLQVEAVPAPKSTPLYREQFELDKTAPLTQKSPELSSVPAFPSGAGQELVPLPAKMAAKPVIMDSAPQMAEPKAFNNVENQIVDGPELNSGQRATFPALPVKQTEEILPAPESLSLQLSDLPLPARSDMSMALQVPPRSGGITAQPVPRVQDQQTDSILETAAKIKSIQEITPFADYEPDPNMREKDPGYHLCPRPDHMPVNENSPSLQCPDMGQMPGGGVVADRDFAHLEYPWVASNICYYPLYFEDVNLERYGHSHRPLVQPFVSVGKFTGQFLALPYQMTMKPVAKCVYPLGYLPPGDACTPKLYYKVPFNAKAAMVTVGVYTGWFFLIP